MDGILQLCRSGVGPLGVPILCALPAQQSQAHQSPLHWFLRRPNFSKAFGFMS